MEKKLTVLLSLLVCCFSCLSLPAQQKTIQKNTVIVYTTAKGTELRLAPNGEMNFKIFKQPLETEPSVFIDPSHSYQAFIGIGGALTDAAAETFAKLSSAQQQEILKAYYDPKDG